MANRNNPNRSVGTGYGDGSKPTQFAKGKSGNPTGRRRKAHKRTINLLQLVTEDVLVTRNGKTKKVPFAVAHIERVKERAAKGDPKADQVLFKLYKDLDLFAQVSPGSDEPFVFTLRIPHPKGGFIDGNSSASNYVINDKANDPDVDKDR
jgi:uncharacterized protein DUF5681